MGKYEFIIALTGIVFAAMIIKSSIESRRQRWLARHAKKQSEQDQPSNDDAAAKLAAMEERIRVLEKIVTDRQSDLRDRFRDLEQD